MHEQNEQHAVRASRLFAMHNPTILSWAPASCTFTGSVVAMASLAHGREQLSIPGPSVMPDRVLQAMHMPSPK